MVTTFMPRSLACLLLGSLALTALAASGPHDSVIGPDYQAAPEMTAKPGAAKGVIHDVTIDATESKIYPGLNGPYKRKVQVYVPVQYVAGTPVPFIIVTDGPWYTKRVATALDNLIAEKRVPVQVAVFVQSGGGDGKGSQRGLEYDTLSGKYTDFIETEILPRIAKDYKINFSKNPSDRAAMGGSSGAACAFTMAWYHPELYRRVLSYSGTFVDQQSPFDPKTPHGAWEYHENLIMKTERKPLRIWMQVGEKDNGWNKDEASLHNWVMANERMADVLAKKGYAYKYVFCKGAGHVDGKAVGQTLPAALEWLWSNQ
jgi:iron(III)-enterobactin esterase